MSRKVHTGDPRTLHEIDRTIHEPSRLMILMYLFGVDSADFLYIERQTGLTRGNLSSHLGRLEDAGYVHIGKEFIDKVPRTVVTMTEDGRRALREYGRMMSAILQNLK